MNLDAPLQNGTVHGTSTVFPVSMARGAAFDLDLEYRIGQASGDEMVAEMNRNDGRVSAAVLTIVRSPQFRMIRGADSED